MYIIYCSSHYLQNKVIKYHLYLSLNIRAPYLNVRRVAPAKSANHLEMGRAGRIAQFVTKSSIVVERFHNESCFWRIYKLFVDLRKFVTSG